MTTYTMNGHQHSTRQIQPEILMGIARNQVARLTRARSRAGASPERFSCLESADPRIQLQEALTQIESLLERNTQLLETVLLLGQALNEAHSLLHRDGSNGLLIQSRLQLSHEQHGQVKELPGDARAETTRSPRNER